MGARKLQQRDRQIVDLARRCSKVGDDPKKSTRAALYYPAVEAYIDFTYSVRQRLNDLRLHKIEESHRVYSNTARRSP
jgi:hypothetical protein